VQSRYAAVANSTLSNKNAGVKAVAEAFGYSSEELSSIPAEANMGLSCGNPTAIASIRSGEVVVDLGSGGGLDVFLASQLVGPKGRAIGIDMTPAMIERARANALAGVIRTWSFIWLRSTRSLLRTLLSIASSAIVLLTLLPTNRLSSGRLPEFSNRVDAWR